VTRDLEIPNIFARVPRQSLGTTVRSLNEVVLRYTILEMSANAQRDGRPAEYRWRPLFNAAKFG